MIRFQRVDPKQAICLARQHAEIKSKHRPVKNFIDKSCRRYARSERTIRAWVKSGYELLRLLC